MIGFLYIIEDNENDRKYFNPTSAESSESESGESSNEDGDSESEFWDDQPSDGMYYIVIVIYGIFIQ